MIYRMQLADLVDEMTFDLLEVPIEDKDIEGTADNTTIDGNVFTDYLWLKKQFVQKWSLMCEDDYTQLRGFYTRQWENAEVPTYKLFVGENRSETLTASGSSFQIQNGTQYDAPLTLTEITGNTTQDGTPTPDAPVAVNTTTGENVVKITGKNLLPFTDQSFTLNGITYSVQNGSLYMNGNSTGEVYSSNNAFKTNFAFTLQAGTYTFSLPEAEAGITSYIDNTASATHLATVNGNTTKSASFTLSEPTAVHLGFYIYNAHPTNKQMLLQLELGSTATSYEPYQGQEFKISLAGENLFDGEMENNGFDGSGLNSWSNQRIRSTNYIPVEPSTQYTIKVYDWNGSKGAVCGVSISYYNANDYTTARLSYLNWTDGGDADGCTFTTPSGCTYIRFLIAIGSNANGNANITTADVGYIQLVKGNALPPSIELAKIGTYQDRIYKDDGKWYIEKQVGKVVLNGTETWNTTGTQYYTSILQSVVAPTPNTSTLLGYSQYFLVQGFNYQSDTNLFFHPNKNLQVKNTNWATLSDWTTWLSTHPTTVYYALATPTTTEITDSTLLSQLNFIANLYGGTNNITFVGTGAQGEIGVEYTLTYEKEQVIIPETPVRLNLTDGGVINPCGCRQNVQLTMRETIQ